MCFATLSRWSSSFLPPILDTCVGATIGLLLNPFTANQMCHTVSNISPIVPCSIGVVGLVTHLWNAKLRMHSERAIDHTTNLELSTHEIICEKVWGYTRDISHITSGIAISTSGMEIGDSILFCDFSSSNLPTIALAIQAPFLAIAIWNSLTVLKIHTPAPAIEITRRASISSSATIAPENIHVIPDWK